MRLKTIARRLAGPLLMSAAPLALADNAFEIRWPSNPDVRPAAPLESAPVAAESLKLTLAATTPLKATKGVLFDFYFPNLLTIEGDDPPAVADIQWSLEGALPEGLSMPSNGLLAGTPNTEGEATFEVTASYADATGRQTYTLVVGGTALTVTQIAVGNNGHVCALTTAGGVKCWGFNDMGQLGNGTLTNSAVPVDVQGLTEGVTRIATGASHSCAVTATGAAKCWGGNWNGELGNGSTETSFTVPVDVENLSTGVTDIGAGLVHTCALLSSGGVKCWGHNNWHGAVGDGTSTNRPTPVDVFGLTEQVRSLSVGGYHSCAVMQDGVAKCWGYNLNGQLGINSTTLSRVPVNVIGLAEGVTRIEAGRQFTCAVTTEGAAKCWGDNGSGQLGDNSTARKLTPVAVSGLGSGVALISAGENHACATLQATNAAVCWGGNSRGQLGNNSTTGSRVPVSVSGLSEPVASIAAGGYLTCAMGNSGKARCWGANEVGQLGNGESADSPVPVNVSR